ncbi:hypothetical protein [Streptomyces sp. BPTC-684]|uniref:hypothetical protein n=1 Tax=Streptomyces sp. BPTC-684 TaxID=3043734 RepID=UPI0024B24AE5|nr:hypothetical protein [Streptomyces sp. BPTC-684]WHM40874.1 hypothetical protein QIY60_31010 [Streptomyces sp. BPTC-684]
MTLRVFLRAAVSVWAATAVAGVALAGTAGMAVAATGGGCTGPASKQACVSLIDDGGHGGDILFEARSDWPDAGRDCRMRLVAFDDTTDWRFERELRRCDQPLDQHFNLPNPTAGHQYRAELQILPNGKNYEFAEFVKSPVLTY